MLLLRLGFVAACIERIPSTVIEVRPMLALKTCALYFFNLQNSACTVISGSGKCRDGFTVLDMNRCIAQIARVVGQTRSVSGSQWARRLCFPGAHSCSWQVFP